MSGATRKLFCCCIIRYQVIWLDKRGGGVANMEDNSSGMFNKTLACIKWTNMNLSFTPVIKMLNMICNRLSYKERETIQSWTF